MKRTAALITSLVLCAASYAANNAPLSGRWNIAPTGSAASSGELLFRMTPGDGSDPVEVTVSVSSGTNELGVARDIRQALGTQLARDRFDVQLGDGANVLVSDPRGRPNFSLELVDSDVENLRVDVRSVDVNASPTVPEQSSPAVPSPAAPTPNTAPGNAAPPTTPSPAPAQPAAPPAGPAPPGTAPPGVAPAISEGVSPANTSGDGASASAPPAPKSSSSAPANSPPPT